MQWLFDVISSIWGLISTLVNLVISTFESVFLIIQMIPEYIYYLSTSISMLPVFIYSFALLIMSFTIVMAIRRLIKGD